MSEVLTPTVFTRRGDTTHEDTGAQAHRIAESVWQTLIHERQHLPSRTAYVWIAHVGPMPQHQDHANTSQDFRHHTRTHGTLASQRGRGVQLTAEPAATSEDIEAVGESFRKLREHFSEAWKRFFVALTRATSETSTLVSWRSVLPHDTSSRASSELAWTEKKNQRRCHLVDKDIDGTISRTEKIELDQLQAEMLAYRRQVAPLPLEDLRKLHQQLLRQASDQTTERL